LVQEFLHVNTGYFTWAGFKQINIIAVSIGGAITLFSFSSFFLKNWRQAEINAAKLRSENISSQFEALKSQVNPHFLFNSLNVLTSLVYEDQNKAAQFIKKLSDVYRYVLEQKGKDLVDLSNELEFVRSYLFLQKIRFGNNLKVEFDLANEMKYKVAPLSIQMLIENAIKHNIVSKEDPLRIVISLNGDNQLEVSNNLQKKNVMEGDSQGIGLENIKQRYAYLTDIEVSVEQIDGRFVVKLPLIVES
jgi:LytS/YehU family sensor histidine kinase